MNAPSPDPPLPAGTTTGVLAVTTTLPGEAEALRIADLLVHERLAACAQVQGPIRSIYRWKGTVEQASEWTLQLKTTHDRFPTLLARLRNLHPYEVPEVIAVPVVEGNPAYLAWVAGEAEAGG